MKFVKGLSNFFNKVRIDHVGEYAANSAYYTFLSFIPFILLLLSLLKYMNIDRDTLIYILEAILPTMTKNSVLDIIQEVYSKSFQTVSISAFFTLWSAANSFYALSLGLSAIYKGEKEKGSYLTLRVKGILGTVITLFSVVTVLILQVFGNRINDILQESFPNAYIISNFIINIRSIVIIISLFIVFVLIYKFVPNKRGNRARDQIPGAIFASIRLASCFIFFLNLCRYFYEFFSYLWKFSNNYTYYDVVICYNLYYFVRC